MRYRVVSIPPALAQEVRATGKSPQYGHPAHSEVAKGYGPCRQCLRKFHESEIESTISRLLGLPSVEYLHVRNREAGCYIARVERVTENDAPSA